VTIGETSGEAPPLGFAFAGQAFFVEAYNAAGEPVTQFVLPFTITVHYSDEEIAGLDETSLSLYYWDANASPPAWVVVTPTIVDIEANTLTATLDHLTDFGVLGERQPGLYLPLIVRAGEVRNNDAAPPSLWLGWLNRFLTLLDWINPQK
jgi:hypothetical protein